MPDNSVVSASMIPPVGNRVAVEKKTQKLANHSGKPSSHIEKLNSNENEHKSRTLGFIAVIIALITGAVSFAVLIGATSIQPTREIIISTVAVNGFFASLLLFLISREIYQLIQSRKRGRAAARLHIRIIGLFSIVAAVPAILVAILAGITLDVGLDRWFESRTKSIVSSSVDVARAYVSESYRGLQGSTVSMARDLDSSRQLFNLDRQGFRKLLTVQTRGRGMLGASIIRFDGSVIVDSNIVQERPLPPPPPKVMETAADGEPVLIPPGGSTNLVGAIFKLSQLDGYLYTLRAVNPKVLRALRLMEAKTAEYRGLENDRLTYQIAFAILYTGVCLIVLLSAIWMGISVADRFVSPIKKLITAADEVSSGNLDISVSTQHAEGALRNLGNTFNTMIAELKSQRDEILTAKDDIDQRARFTEAVLSGVSAAVLGVNEKGRLTIANPPARVILGLSENQTLVGEKLSMISPDLSVVLECALRSPQNHYHEQITLVQDSTERTLSVQVTKEDSHIGKQEWVITFDDITQLVEAQRSNAWADVAQRIAHEIKNPLTPIQLSAERIRRRFGKQIEQDKEIFEQCTDTIVRQVSDIGRMVDEFSSFARMPKPDMKVQNLSEAIREAVFLQKVANPEITYKTNFPSEKLVGIFDARLLSQALTNVIKNAAEAIEGNETQGKEKGIIQINAYEKDAFLVVDIIDNGKGLPKENRQKLLEPYMTTRVKGTGLGLAIVRKILEDHGGAIQLMDAPQVENGGHGALMRLTVPAGGE